MQKYCPNNSNFTFREICCAPPKNKDECENKKHDNKGCNNPFDFCLPFPPFCCPPFDDCFKNKDKNSPPCNCPPHKAPDCSHSNKNKCCPHMPQCPTYPPSINIQLDYRFLLWTSLYPCIFHGQTKN